MTKTNTTQKSFKQLQLDATKIVFGLQNEGESKTVTPTDRTDKLFGAKGIPRHTFPSLYEARPPKATAIPMLEGA